MTAGIAPPRRLVRDRPTITLYAMFVTWGWYLYAFAPAVPLIAAEQGVSRALAGLHGTAMACGTVLSGSVSSRIAVRWGRRLQSMAGATLLSVAVVLLLVGPGLPATLAASFVAAIGGNLMVSAALPALAVHHGLAGPAAVTEANAMGASFGLLAPLALGGAVALGWGWRPAVGLSIVLAVTAASLMLRLRGVPALGRGVARHSVTQGGRARSFPVAFWLFWTAMLCGAGIEFATTFWAADLLVNQTGAAPSLAAAAISALVVGMAVSRFVVGPLALRKAPEKLLLIGFATAGLGWLVFWLAGSPGVAMVGLVVAGLGYGTHFPLSVSLALRASEGRPDQAQARASLGTGAAVGLAPFALGALADHVGTHQAFLLVAGLIVAGGVATVLGLRSVHRSVHRAE